MWYSERQESKTAICRNTLLSFTFAGMGRRNFQRLHKLDKILVLAYCQLLISIIIHEYLVFISSNLAWIFSCFIRRFGCSNQWRTQFFPTHHSSSPRPRFRPISESITFFRGHRICSPRTQFSTICLCKSPYGSVWNVMCILKRIDPCRLHYFSSFVMLWLWNFSFIAKESMNSLHCVIVVYLFAM